MSSPLGPTNQTGSPSGTVPTIAPATGAGTTATATVATGSLDQRGAVSIASAGTGQAAGVLAVVTFAKGLATQYVPQVMITELTGASSALNPYVTAVTPQGFSIASNSAPTAAVTYQFGYVVIP